MLTFSKLGQFGATGNQLFQYAALLGISKKTGHKIKIPSFPDNDVTGKIFLHGHNDKNHPIETWEYALGCFRVQCDFLTTADTVQYSYNEPHFCFDSRVFNMPDSVDITGYFQSEKYFAHCTDEVRKQLTPREDFMLLASQRLDALGIDKTKSIVSIHIRRVGHEDPKAQDVHPLVPMSFYSRAIEYFREHLDVPQFVIFSDDIPWCKQNIYHDDVTFMEGNDPIVDLAAMTLCDHHVIANSSFSWWGAWLNKKNNKIIIRPDRWFGPSGPQDTQDLFPEDWKRIGDLV